MFYIIYFQLDVNGSGCITANELGQAFTKTGQSVPGYKLREMISEVDKTENGTVDLNEFIEVHLDGLFLNELKLLCSLAESFPSDGSV